MLTTTSVAPRRCPRARSSNAAFLDAELATVFADSWQVLPERGDDPRPLDEQLAPRGSRVPITVNGRPLFLQRGWDDDVLRAFPNTCTHAWFPLVLGASRAGRRSCAVSTAAGSTAPARFVSQQGFGGAAGLPARMRSPPSLPVATWRRLTWVDAVGRRAAARGRAARGRRVARGDAGAARADVARRSATSRATGSSTRGTTSTRSTSGSSTARRTGSPMRSISAATRPSCTSTRCCSGSTRATPADGFDPARLPDAVRRSEGPPRVRAVVVRVPEPALNFYPWGLSVNVYAPVPDRPDATRFIWYQFALDREQARAARSPLAVVAGRRRGRRRPGAGRARPALGIRAARPVRAGARAGGALVSSQGVARGRC